MYLTTNTIPGATYLWNGPMGFVSTAQNPGVGNMQSNNAGLYTLTVNTPGCGTITATTLTSVTPGLSGAQALANTPVCAGGNLNLSASIRNNYTYSWTGPNGFTSTLAEPVIPNVTTAAQGNYTVVFTALGCGTSSRSRSVSIVDPSSVQALNSGPVCVGNAVFFTGRGPAGSTFSWTGPLAFATNRQNPSLSNVQLNHAGVYTLSVNVPGCGVVTTTTTLVVNPCREHEALQVPTDLGLVDAVDNNSISKLNLTAADAATPATFTISPNPSDGSELNLIWSGLQDTESPIYLSILDVTGKEIYTTLISEGRTVATDTQYLFRPAVALPKGVYQIRSRCGNHEYNAKWLVQ
jgi:rRNA maturation protein Nop10